MAASLVCGLRMQPGGKPPSAGVGRHRPKGAALGAGRSEATTRAAAFALRRRVALTARDEGSPLTNESQPQAVRSPCAPIVTRMGRDAADLRPEILHAARGAKRVVRFPP